MGPFGARFYDRAAWSSIDPLAEKYYSLSPYNYCAGNPIIFVDGDGRDFKKKIRGNSITISAAYYVDANSQISVQSAKQAIAFWNRRQDTYISKSGEEYIIKYKLILIKTDALQEFIEESNTYEVTDKLDSLFTSGTTTNKHNIRILKSYSIYRPNSKIESTTGAHEIGHTLGMSDTHQGIMSYTQDSSRSDEVTQENLSQMLNSSVGKTGFISRLIKFIANLFYYDKEN